MNQLKTILLLGLLSALLVGVGGAIAPGALGFLVALALLMNLGAYFWSDRIVLRMHGARPVTAEEAPDLHRMVEQLSERAGIDKPRLFLIPSPQPNAFATGRSPRHGVVAVTEGILRLLDRRELRGVIAHEIAHIANRDILISTIAAAIAAIVGYVAHLSLWFSPRDGEGSGAGGLLTALFAPIAATLVQLGISRSREYLADETGGRLCEDPNALANALLKLERAAHLVPMEAAPATASLFIVNPFAGGGGMLRLFSTHPPTGERVRRLRILADELPFAA